QRRADLQIPRRPGGVFVEQQRIVVEGGRALRNQRGVAEQSRYVWTIDLGDVQAAGEQQVCRRRVIGDDADHERLGEIVRRRSARPPLPIVTSVQGDVVTMDSLRDGVGAATERLTGELIFVVQPGGTDDHRRGEGVNCVVEGRLQV